MIKQVSEDWQELERTAKAAGNMNAEHFENLMRSIAGVKAVLKKMCDVSVTRTTLAEAVREALPPILHDGGPELLPSLYEEVARLRARIDEMEAAVARSGVAAEAAPPSRAADVEAREATFRAEISARLEDFEARVRRLAEFDEELRSVKDGMDRVDARLAEVGPRLDGMEGRFEWVQTEITGLSARLQGIEAKVREIEGRVGQTESKLDSEAERISARVEAISETIQEVDARVAGVQEKFDSNAASWNERLGQLSLGIEAVSQESIRKIAEADQKREIALSELRSSLEEKLRAGILVLEERLEAARGYFMGLLSKLETSFPETLRAETTALEARIRKEIDEVVNGLDEKLSDLKTIIARLDTRLQAVSGHVEGLEAVFPALRTIERELGGLKDALASVSSQIGESHRDLSGLESAVADRLADLRSLLDLGIQRWEEDQSQMLERLGAIRDTLRDEFRKVSEQVTEQSKSLWGRLTGRGEGGLRLSREDWEQLAGKIEGIISGLETVLSRRRSPQASPPQAEEGRQG